MIRKTMLAAAVSLAVISTAAFAAVDFNSITGTGFVGKGDVQFALGWNNKQLQDGAGTVAFSFDSTTVTEVEWTCKRDAGEQYQERSRTTTNSKQGLVEHVARERNQITGFTLSGFDGAPTSSSTSDGPALGSCPTFWTNISGVSDPVVVSSDGGLSVNGKAL